MKNLRSNLNLLAVSAGLQEPAINVPQAVDQSLLISVDDYINIERRTEDNSGEANGLEEADLIYDSGATAAGSLTFDKMQPNQAAFMLAYGLGAVGTVAAGTGFEHTITPIVGDVDEARSNPSFTTLQRYGETIGKRRIVSCFVDALTMTFAADDWVKGSADIMATGKHDNNVVAVTASGLDTDTSILFPDPVDPLFGADLAERLDSIHAFRVYYNGAWHWQEVTDAVYAANTGLTITFTSLGGAGGTVEYRCLYRIEETTWTAFPARVVETPLRVSQMCLTIGGAWTGSEFDGGKQISADLQSAEYALSNNGEIKFTPCAGGSYAGKYVRAARTQTVKLSRDMRDFLLQHYADTSEYFGLRIMCVGGEYDTGHYYTVELVFPRLGLLAVPISTSDGVVSESGDMQVLEDGTYGSVICHVKNMVAGYAA